MGAPIGNVNNLKTGRRSSRPGTVLARLGPRYSQPYQDVCRLRRGVESLLKQRHGRVSLLQAARIQTLCRLELNCRLAELSVRDHRDMSVESLRAERSVIAQWSQQRDNVLMELVGDCGGGSADPLAAALEAARAARGPVAAQDIPSAADAAEGPPSPETPQEATSRIVEATTPGAAGSAA